MADWSNHTVGYNFQSKFVTKNKMFPLFVDFIATPRNTILKVNSSRETKFLISTF